MSGEELCRTEDKASKCLAVRRNAGRMAIGPLVGDVARASVTLQKQEQSFHLFSEIVLRFFHFFVTGGTYMTIKLGPKCSEKKKAKFLYVHICYFSEVEVIMMRTGKLCFDAGSDLDRKP